jgi:hypothetical protein
MGLQILMQSHEVLDCTSSGREGQARHAVSHLWGVAELVSEPVS